MISRYRYIELLILTVPLLAAVGCSDRDNSVTAVKETRTSVVHEPRISLEEVEQGYLQKFREIASRNGETLELRLANGKTERFTNRPKPLNSEEGDVRYIFLGAVEPIGYFKLRAAYWLGEAGGPILVNMTNGEKYSVDTDPIISPRQDYFVTVITCDAYCSPRLQVWAVGKDNLKLECYFTLVGYWSGAKAVWINAETIEVTKTVSNPTGKGFVDVPFRLVRTSQGWELADKQNPSLDPASCVIENKVGFIESLPGNIRHDANL